MRKGLKNINGKRECFTGVFVRYGTKSSFRGPRKTTILLKDIKDQNGVILTDHLWFNLTKGFDEYDLKEGDIISFDARVKKYQKGYKGYREDVYEPIETDYKLSHPSKIKK